MGREIVDANSNDRFRQIRSLIEAMPSTRYRLKAAVWHCELGAPYRSLRTAECHSLVRLFLTKSSLLACVQESADLIDPARCAYYHPLITLMQRATVKQLYAILLGIDLSHQLL